LNDDIVDIKRAFLFCALPYMDPNKFVTFITEILLDYWFSGNKEVEIKKMVFRYF